VINNLPIGTTVASNGRVENVDVADNRVRGSKVGLSITGATSNYGNGYSLLSNSVRDIRLTSNDLERNTQACRVMDEYRDGGSAVMLGNKALASCPVRPPMPSLPCNKIVHKLLADLAAGVGLDEQPFG